MVKDKERTKFPLERAYNKALLLLRILCIALILLVLSNAISFIFDVPFIFNISPEVSSGLIWQLVLLSIMVMAAALVPLTKVFVLNKEIKQSHKQMLIGFIAVIMMLFTMLYIIIDFINMFLGNTAFNLF